MYLALSLALLAVTPHPAAAASMSRKDVQIFGRALGFLSPAPDGAWTVAVAYTDDASKADAEAIAAWFGAGLKTGDTVSKSKLFPAAGLASGGFVVVIVAQGGPLDQASALSGSAHIPCVTASQLDVASGRCMMAITTDPKVEIRVSRAIASAANVSFTGAVRMMSHGL